ncbi:metalloprotease PmbA [Wenzhouxiangella limi]
MSRVDLLAEGGVTGLLDDPERENELLTGIARRMLDRAARRGADQAEVGVSSGLNREAGVRLGEVEVLEEARDRGVRVTVYRDGCSGSASTGDLRPEILDQTVDRALAIARHTQLDPASGLAEAELMATSLPDLDLWHPLDVSMDTLIRRAQEIEQAGRGGDKRISNSEGASVSAEAALSVYANSHGFLGSQRGTRYSQHCILIAADDSGMQRDYDWDARRRFDQLADPATTGREAARRTAARLGVRRMPTGRFPVLFVPEVARGLIGHLVGAVSGGQLYRRASFLLDSLGSRVLPEWASLIESPRLPGGPASSAFDGDGVATKDSALVAQGILERYVLGSYSARRLGLTTTANAGGVRNLRFSGGGHSYDDLVAELGRGLIVTEVMGQGVNLVTGDYSRGAAGFWVENGEIAWPVEEITIAGHLREMLTGLRAAGIDHDERRSIQVPSLLVDEMTVAGQDA